MKLPNFHQKVGSYYYVTGTTPRKWIPLGRDLATAIRRYERIQKTHRAGTLGSLLADFLLKPPASVSAATMPIYRVHVRHLTRVFGELYPDEVTRADVLKYIDLCPRKSAMTEISILRRVYERAIRTGESLANPCLSVRPEVRIKTKRTRLITDDELAKIRAHARPVLRVAIDLAYATGLRPGDLCRLRFGDLESGVQTQKTGVRLRWEMTDDLRAILDAARALQGRVACLWVISERAQQVKLDHLRDLWQKACAAAGVTDAQFRDIRAMAASADPESAQRRLGHTTAQMTRTYLRGREVVAVQPLRRRSGS